MLNTTLKRTFKYEKITEKSVKICTLCSIPKHPTLFNKSLCGTFGRETRCKSCRKNVTRIWNQENKEKLYEQNKAIRLVNPENQFWYHIKWKYKLSKEAYLEMFTAQNGCCAICFKVEQEKLCVDHNHVTNKIRGLLCRGCNRHLGHFQDSITIVANAIDYIKKHAQN